MIVTPRFSVITVVLNAEMHLQECLESVADQQGVSFEHIVIDGGSTDGSLDMLHRWSSRLAWFRSEPDDGIADAMNKGIAQARGEWLLFLQADDYLVGPDALRCADELLADSIDVACFPILFGSPPALARYNPRPMGWWFNFKMGMSHQGCLIRRTTIERIGTYDCGYRFNMDYDLLMRAHRAGLRLRTFPEPVLAVMRDTGISSRRDWKSISSRLIEERSVHLRHAPAGMSVLYRMYWNLYLNFRRIVTWLRG